MPMPSSAHSLKPRALEDGNIAVVKAAYEDFMHGAFDALLERLDESIVWEMPFPAEIVPYGGKHVGKAAVKTFFDTFVRTTEVLRFEPQEFIASGDVVVALGLYHGKARHTGRSAQSDIALVFRLRDGKITSFKKFADTHAVVESWR
jgi:ketosteroid isomerase-like protein